MKKLTKEQVEEIRKLYKEGASQSELALKFSVSQPIISYWVNDESRKKIIQRSVESFRNLSTEERKAKYNKRKVYMKNYLNKRYHQDKDFRRKVIDKQIEYNKRKKNEQTI
jgi:predicted transcriptional regulator